MISQSLASGKFIVIQPNSKLPLISKGEDWNNHLIDYDQANEEIEKGDNIGLVCGHGGLICIDCDDHRLYEACAQLLPPI